MTVRETETMKNLAYLKDLIPEVEKHSLRHTAICDDGSVFFVPVASDGKTVLGGPILLTPAKMRKLAALQLPHRS